MHFDLSECGALKNYCLNIPRSMSHKMPLQRHTSLTRTTFRTRIQALVDIPDSQLTHFAVNVDLGPNASNQFWITSLDHEIAGRIDTIVPVVVLASV